MEQRPSNLLSLHFGIIYFSFVELQVQTKHLLTILHFSYHDGTNSIWSHEGIKSDKMLFYLEVPPIPSCILFLFYFCGCFLFWNSSLIFSLLMSCLVLTKLGELKLGELLDTPPPGLDEAIAISKASMVRLAFVISLLVFLSDCILNFPCFLTDNRTCFQVMQFLESQQYSIFTRIVFDTAPTVRKSLHTSHLFLISTIGLDKLSLTGSYTAAFVLARFLGCIYWQDIEGRNLNWDKRKFMTELVCWSNAEYEWFSSGRSIRCIWPFAKYTYKHNDEQNFLFG